MCRAGRWWGKGDGGGFGPVNPPRLWGRRQRGPAGRPDAGYKQLGIERPPASHPLPPTRLLPPPGGSTAPSGCPISASRTPS